MYPRCQYRVQYLSPLQRNSRALTTVTVHNKLKIEETSRDSSWPKCTSNLDFLMYNGIGLQTARGSGTNGYVQKSLAYVRPKQVYKSNYDYTHDDAPHARTPNAGILLHEQKRTVEIKCLELQDRLEEFGVDEASVEEQVQELREKLTVKMAEAEVETRKLKEHAVHQIAAAKIKQTAKLASAFGIASDYVEGQAFDRDLQARKRQERHAENAERKAMRDDRDEAVKARAQERLKRDDARNRSRSRERIGRSSHDRERSRSPRGRYDRGRSPTRYSRSSNSRKAPSYSPSSSGSSRSPSSCSSSRSRSRSRLRSRRSKDSRSRSPPRRREASRSISRSRSPRRQDLKR